jgi:chitinase
MRVLSTSSDHARLRSRTRLLIIALIVTLIATLALHARRETQAAANFPNGFKSIGYQPSWAGDVNALPYSKMTHVNYSFLGYNTDGSLKAIDNAAKLQSLVSLGHQNGVKVFIAIGGWTGDGYDDTFEAIAGNATARNNFVNNVRNFVNQYGLDGVDIDWEYPTVASNYTALMQGLSGFLRPAGKGLSTAVVSDGSAANAITSAAYGYIDWFNVMAYDGGSPHANYNWSIASFNYWRNTKGVPVNKIVLGVPFYSRPAGKAYRDYVAQNTAYADQDCVGSDCYNGRPTVRSKTQYVRSQGGGGIMYWDTSNDTTGSLAQYSLISAIYEAAMGTSTPPPPTATRTPTPGGPTPTQVPGGGISTTAWYAVISQNSNKCLDNTGPSTANGTKLQQWTCFYGNNQQWQFQATDSGYYRIVNRYAPNLVIDVSGPSTANGALVHLWTYGGGTNQQWKPESMGSGIWRFRARHSGRCLDVPAASTADGVQLQQYDCNGSAAQSFRLSQR